MLNSPSPADHSFRFEIGQTVAHRAGGLVATIRHRTRTAMGREMYGVDSQDDRAMRFFLGEVLVEVAPLEAAPMDRAA